MALRAASVAAPGGAVVHVEHAPPHEEHVFSRDHVVVSTETGMVDRMGGLRQETIAKNAELQRQIDGLRTRRVAVAGQLEEEARRRDEAFAKLRDALSADMAAFKVDLSASIDKVNKSFSEVSLVAVAKRLDADVVTEEAFYKETVPATNEAQTGELIRRMIRSRESFDIDNANLRSREANIIRRFDEHCKGTAARFAAEAEDRTSTSTALRESLHTWVSTTDRGSEAVVVGLTSSLADLRGMRDGEAAARAAADSVVLDTLQRSMQKLQAQILDSFGSV